MNIPDFKTIETCTLQAINPLKNSRVEARFNIASNGELITLTLTDTLLCNWTLKEIEKRLLKKPTATSKPYIGISSGLDSKIITLTIRTSELKKEFIHEIS